MSQHVVTIKKPLSFPADRRIRAGVVVLKDGGYTGVLTDDQLKAIKADAELEVREVKSKKDEPKK